MKTEIKLTQAQIADQSNLSRPMLSMILSGKKRLGKKSISGLSKTLKINPVILLNASPEEIIEIIKSKMPAPQPDRADPRVDGSGASHG